MKTPTRSNLCFAFIMLLLVFACEKERFSQEKPFAVVIEKYRQLRDAENTQKRLKNMGLDPYIVAQKNKEEGLWFKLMIGGSVYLEDMTTKKINLEDTYRLQDIQIANFNQIAQEMLPLDSFPTVKKLSGKEPPQVDSLFYELLNWLPHHPEFNIEKLTLYNPQDSFNINRLANVKNAQADWPRGLSQAEVFKNALCFAEVRYADRIAGKKVTVQAIIFKQDHQYEGDLVEHFADKIISTREYPLEEKIPVVITEGRGLTGYKVNISPRDGWIKRYLVLSDGRQQILFFVQSENDIPEDMELISNYLGKDQGLPGSAALRDIFYALPEKLPDDKLVFFDLEYKEDATGSLASRLPGHHQGNFVFLSAQDGVWQLMLTKTYEEEMAEFFFDKFYNWNKKIKKDQLVLAERPAYFAYATRRERNGRKYQKVINELQFYTANYVGSISNQNQGFLSAEQMKSYYSSLRLYP